MLDNIQEHKIAHKVFAMNKPLLIFHATEDDTVLIEQAEKKQQSIPRVSFRWVRRITF
jgi:dipeptidyl aminopeptidase/acylaminoacyl peptidase